MSTVQCVASTTDVTHFPLEKMYYVLYHVNFSSLFLVPGYCKMVLVLPVTFLLTQLKYSVAFQSGVHKKP